MPFQQVFPRSFTANSIREHAPALSGVYGITNAKEWILIGEADNIRDALITHLQEPGTPLLQHNPKGFVYELCDPLNRRIRQERLILEYQKTSPRRL
jgi:hypothetical protein